MTTTTTHLTGRAHESVLLKEAIDSLAVAPSDIVVDATVGGAGHFKALAEKLGPQGTLIGIDADEEALTRARAVVPRVAGTVHLVEENFRHLTVVLDSLHLTHIDKALFDLGWSGYQLQRGRGFSFRAHEPLLMTYGTPHAGTTAADAVNTLPERALADMFYTLGEERYARAIARGIVSERARQRILTTGDLVAVIERATPRFYHTRRLHPATKTFQALRMYVNDELGALTEGFSGALNRLNANGRVAVITFHSIEDRLVKHLMREAAQDGKGMVLTKKPIVPTREECAHNPRARSAKLRVFVGNAPVTTYA